MLIEPRFIPVFAHLDEEEWGTEAKDLLNTALDELETWAA